MPKKSTRPNVHELQELLHDANHEIALLRNKLDAFNINKNATAYDDWSEVFGTQGCSFGREPEDDDASCPSDEVQHTDGEDQSDEFASDSDTTEANPAQEIREKRTGKSRRHDASRKTARIEKPKRVSLIDRGTGGH